MLREAFLIFELTNLGKVRQEVGPHYVMLVYVGADDLTHLNEVLGQKSSVVLAHASNLVQALVRVEGKLLSRIFQLLRILTEHKFECLIFVGDKLFLAAHEIVHGALRVAPLAAVLVAEKFFFTIV